MEHSTTLLPDRSNLLESSVNLLAKAWPLTSHCILCGVCMCLQVGATSTAICSSCFTGIPDKMLGSVGRFEKEKKAIVITNFRFLIRWLSYFVTNVPVYMFYNLSKSVRLFTQSFEKWWYFQHFWLRYCRGTRPRVHWCHFYWACVICACALTHYIKFTSLVQINKVEGRSDP